MRIGVEDDVTQTIYLPFSGSDPEPPRPLGAALKADLQPVLPHLGATRDDSPVRRRVFRVRLSPTHDGTYTFRAHSFSSQRGPVYYIRVNPRTGYATCTCADYRYRRAQGTGVCKHLRRALLTAAKAERDRHPELRLAA